MIAKKTGWGQEGKGGLWWREVNTGVDKLYA